MADIPKIRFKGFTEPWEQRKVKDISDFIDGNYGEKYPRDDEFVDSGIPFFTSAVTGSEGIFNEKNVKFISTEKNRELTKAQSQGGDLILTNRGASMGVIAEIPEKYGLVNIGPQLTRIRGKEKEANNKYLLCLFQTSTNNKKLTSMNAGSAMPFIGLKGLGNIDLLIPQYDEQLKIGEYFSCLDHFITLHQRKYFIMYNKLITWEQRKLEAVLSLLKDGTHGTHQDAEEGPYLLSAKNIKNGQIIIDDSSDRKISEDEFNQIHTKFTLENGDILLTIVGSIGESAILESAGKFTFQRSVAFLRPSEEMTSRFLKTEIESVQFQKELNDRKSQSAQPGVYLGDLSKIPIYITSKEEQKKIGKYFSHLDNLITLHQRKCDTLKELKKYMLQNMFPKKG